MDAIAISADGVRLAADFHPADGALAFVVSHGWGSERPVDIPAALAEAGFPALAYDLRGHGQSAARLDAISRADWVADLVAVIDEMAHLAPGCRIGLVGASFGAYLSLMASDTRDVAGLSLRVPANLPDDDFDLPYLDRFGPESGRRRPRDLTPSGSRSLRALRAFRGSVQIVDASDDDVIPPQTIDDYAALVPPARLSRHTLHGPHHLATPELRTEYIGVLVAWARSTAR